MEALEQFSQNQRLIEEFTSKWLLRIPTDFGRLMYVALLRDVSSGRYRHPLLEDDFSEAAVHQALLYCHEELFGRVLELPLEWEERDLRQCFATMDSPAAEIAKRWLELEFFRLLVPLALPGYLHELFCSNLRVLLRLIASDQAKLQTAA